MAERREHCRRCGKHWQECGQLSYRGLCEGCGTLAAVEAARQMAAREGPYYDAWLASNACKESTAA